MNNNDLIRRGDVLARKEVITEEFHEHGASMSISHSVVTVDNINAIPAVEQQMSAVEYLYQRERMKAEMGFPFCIPDKDKIRACVALVAKWAAEHFKEVNNEID